MQNKEKNFKIEPPNTLKDLFYFANRRPNENSYIKAWAYKLKCPNCNVFLEKKKLKGRSKIIYECPKCCFSMDKKKYHSKVRVYIMYKCPYCLHEGITYIDGFKRKKYGKKKGIGFKCENCGNTIIIEQLKSK